MSGVGTSHFGRFGDRRIEELAWSAITEALVDADLGPGDIDAAIVSSVFGPPGLANRVLVGVGLAGIPVFQVEAACASGTVAFHEAATSVGAGRFDRVLAVGVEQLSTQFAGAIIPEPSDPDGRSGLAMPALYALQANRHVHVHGLDPDLLAHVAVKNKRHGAANPRAHLGDAGLTLDRVLDSRPIAGPLTLLQCCPMTDGAAAAVLESPRAAADRCHDRSVSVLSSRFASGRPWGSHTALPWGFDTVRSTATAALDDAGVTLDDVDLFEVHDAFTIGEVLTVEAIGLAQPGGGAELTANGTTALGGPRPVNPSGGLLSRGHPLGATGLAQIAEAAWQLRGEAGERQVPDASTALVETMGGGAAGVDANACVVSVLRGPA
ncbi:MAG: thiolase family protein [Actinomycetota bacterium]